MTITSTNINPKNSTKYARRRSLWKGDSSQLRQVIEGLQGAGCNVSVHVGVHKKAIESFINIWGNQYTRTRGLRVFHVSKQKRGVFPFTSFDVHSSKPSDEAYSVVPGSDGRVPS